MQRNSFPGQRRVAITAFGECVWMTAPAARWRYGNIWKLKICTQIQWCVKGIYTKYFQLTNNGVHWLFFNLKKKMMGKLPENFHFAWKTYQNSGLTFYNQGEVECHRLQCFGWIDLPVKCALFAHLMERCKSRRCNNHIENFHVYKWRFSNN